MLEQKCLLHAQMHIINYVLLQIPLLGIIPSLFFFLLQSEIWIILWIYIEIGKEKKWKARKIIVCMFWRIYWVVVNEKYRTGGG